jgi:hypothetical protein
VGFSYAELPSKKSLRWSFSEHSFLVKTNAKLSGPIKLTFSSVPNKVLSVEPVVFYVEGKLVEGRAKLTEIHFDQGHNMPSGYYDVKISGVDILGKLQESKNLKLEDAYYIYEGLYFTDVEAENNESGRLAFDKKLENFKLAQNLKSKKIHSEIIERYSTLTSLLSYLEQLFSTEVGRLKRGEEISQFSDKYGQEIAMIMHGVAIDHKDIQSNLDQNKATDQFLQKEYHQLSNIGRDVGENVVNFINEIEAQSRVDQQGRDAYINRFHTKISEFQGRIAHQVQIIRDNSDE